jgi:phenylacetate-coenzyme A ligase PaaK-like adenylate-forming protein
MKSRISKHKVADIKEVADSFSKSILTRTSNEWSKTQEKKLLSVFKEASTSVYAYKQFLQDKKVESKDIKNLKKFMSLPIVTKKQYLRAYSWDSLLKTQSLSTLPLVMTSTSGSTGEPFYFPRATSVDIQSSLLHEVFLRSARISKTKSTFRLRY